MMTTFIAFVLAVFVVLVFILLVYWLVSDMVRWFRELRDSWNEKDTPHNGWGGSV